MASLRLTNIKALSVNTYRKVWQGENALYAEIYGCARPLHRSRSGKWYYKVGVQRVYVKFRVKAWSRAATN